ncbi:hypothetical protein F4777DRAFT_107333 [Nemania sp. FL0916]|nr:hypothetical protein F4777DRAFT_107333 [Nemania sp. FL0916]
MDSASPTASASTNRGGRPKEWTEPRTRRLVRLYVYTKLPFVKILELLEEDEFKPGKDAANKVKNNVLGNDPRWIRPKDDQEEAARIRGLRNSLRGRQRRQTTPSQPVNGTTAEPSYACGPGPENGSIGGTTLAQSYHSSSDELHYRLPDAASFAYRDTPTAANTFNTFTTANDEPSSRFFPGLMRRLTRSRQDTGLTSSTDISITSVLQEKLSALGYDRMKRAVKVLKRYTFPKNFDPQHGPSVTPNLFQGPGFQSPTDPINDQFNAAHALPGDFMDPDLFPRREQCAAEYPAHARGVCWCVISDRLSGMSLGWRAPTTLSDPILLTTDDFGNTIFHFLATQESFQELLFHLVDQVLRESRGAREPRLPIHGSNTAGQTFLHVLHHSWFQEGSRLDELLAALQTIDFDLYATDVYGRSFFHILRLKRPNSARFPGQPSNVNRLNRRDAFGRKPMDTRSATMPPASRSPTAQVIKMEAPPPLNLARQVPMIDTQTGPDDDKIQITANLMKIINAAIATDNNSHNPQIEDYQGRNGFHCLAEADFHLGPSTPKHGARNYPNEDLKPGLHGHKRKHIDNEDIEVPQTASSTLRRSLIAGLTHAKVDANHYDKQGNTPLMSFVVNSGDATKFEKEESEVVIRALVKDAGAKLELRNRNGETALHLAARYGKTVALRVLLELGANPNTRNAQGLSILEVVDNLYSTTECDDKHNARFEAARAILTRPGSEQSPTLIQEWSRII